MTNKTLALTFLAACFSITILSWRTKPELKPLETDVKQMTVEQMLYNLGAPKYNHAIEQADPELAEVGRKLILNGKATYKGHRGKLVSIHFVCTDCHNLVKETENPAELNPEKRMDYARKNGLNFLPGSTLWGIYDRKRWYNDDYAKKYGDIIKNAVDSLHNSVQVCAKYCSSGRFLEKWELDAIMHYFKANQLKIKDLPFTEQELEQLASWRNLEPSVKSNLRKRVESSFVRAFPATHLETMPRDQRKYGEGANAENGEKLFEKSCMSCHFNKRVTYLNIEKDKLTAKLFWNNIKDYNDLTLYQIIRWGTWAKTGRKQYMPYYTKEKMSDGQIEDLVAYIRKLANK